MSSRQEYVEQLHKQLDEWNRKLDDLEKKMNNMKIKDRSMFRDEIDYLRKKKDSIEESIGKIVNAESGAFDEMKKGVESAWNELSNAFVKSMSKFSDEMGKSNR
jgi:predicted  nucleic acid-binding Zn-ribbon protein